MSAIKKTLLSTDELPILPETRPVEPLVQCGVLYLGTAPPSIGRRGLDSIQEPLSHRYPVDGTNTIRGIDAVLSIYHNGIQLEFTRHPHVAIFFPLTSLIYCASVRFSIIENEQTKLTSMVDWRFMPLDELINDDDNNHKHPPLFCAQVQRTEIFPGDECHCFITKSIDASLTLVRIISQVYSNLQSNIKSLKSPIFYQLDYFGRRIKELTNVIYISPAIDDDSELNRLNSNGLINESIIRNYLFNPSFNGFFYRTDTSTIEQWQLWDNDDLIGSRPHPPASPFGLHEGLYHDDTSQEIQRYLRQMDNEEQSCSCNHSIKNSSSSSRSSHSSISTDYSIRQSQQHSIKQKSSESDDSDQFNISVLNLESSSFEPIPNNFERKKPPIIIEKVLKKPISSIPILNPQLPRQISEHSNSTQEVNLNYIPISDIPSLTYRINERGEKITKEGNRIIYMDVVRPNLNNAKQQIDLPTYNSSESNSRSYRKRSSKKHLPIYDVHSIQKLYEEKKAKSHRQIDNNSNNTKPTSTSNTIEIFDGYFEDPSGHKTKLNQFEARTILDHFESSSKTKQKRKNSTISSTSSSKSSSNHHRRNQLKNIPTTTTTTHSLNTYEEDPSITSVSQTHIKHISPTLSHLTNDKLNEYVANIYGLPQSIKSTSPSTKEEEEELKSVDKTAVFNAAYVSAFRYMQSNINSNLIQEYRNAY